MMQRHCGLSQQLDYSFLANASSVNQRSVSIDISGECACAVGQEQLDRVRIASHR